MTNIIKKSHPNQTLKKIICLVFPMIMASGSCNSDMLASESSEDAKVNQIADSYLQALYEAKPEWTTVLHLKDALNYKFNDHSFAGVQKLQATEDKFLSDLKAVDINKLSTTAKVNYKTILESLESSQIARVCHNELWNLSTYYPWFTELADVAHEQPVASLDDQADALARWKTFGVVTEQEIYKLRQGLSEGYSMPKIVLHRIINQLSSLLELAAEDSPFYVATGKETSDKFKQEFSSVMVNTINPSLVKFKDFLVNEYLPQARDDIGVSSQVNGEACYKAMLRKHTTKNISPLEVHNYGVETVEKLSKQLAEISQQYFGGMSNKDLIQLASKKTKPFNSVQEVLEYNYLALERVKAILPKLMTVSPRSEFTVKPYPEYRAKAGAAGEYHLPSRDGSTPGIFYINTYNYQNMAYADLESTLFHEAIPGHHLQLSLLIENENIHPITEDLMSSSPVEGWGLYSEVLANEFDLFSDPLARVGYLSNALLRASRLVIDTGIHSYGWSKEKAVQYLSERTVLDETKINSEIDRYITWPGQATSYYIGLRAILNARAYAKAQLGDNFSLQRFNDLILSMGPVPLEYMADVVEKWVIAEKSK